MNILDKLTIRTKLTLITLGFTITFLVLLITSIIQINNVVELTKKETEIIKIGGNFYKKIESLKDLKADILPPPIFIVELNEVLFELLLTNNQQIINEKLEWYADYKKVFKERKEYWYKNLPKDEMKTELLNSAVPLAENIFNIVDNEFMPNFKMGNREQCYSILRTKIIPVFYQHKQSINKVADFTDEKTMQLEDEAKQLEKSIYQSISENNQKTILMISLISGILFVVSAIFILIVSRNINTNAKNAFKRINQLANGQI